MLTTPPRQTRRRISAASRRALWERDQGCCGLCGQPVALAEAVVDHILPVAHGGATTPDNLQVAHGSCNAYKASSPNTDRWQGRVTLLREHAHPVEWLVVEETTRQRGRVSWEVEASPEYDRWRRRHWWAPARVLAAFPYRERALRMVWKLNAIPMPCHECGNPWSSHEDDGACPKRSDGR